MIIRRYSETYLNANCYILGAEAGVVVDPGAGSAQWAASTLAELHLDLAGVLLTHGHADHVWDAAIVAGEAPVWIMDADRVRLEDPARGNLHPAELIAAIAGHPWQRPVRIERADAGFTAGGITFEVLPAPGHTEGSAVFTFAGELDSASRTLLSSDAHPTLHALTGDVIFRNGIGRTDLMGGDADAMRISLGYLRDHLEPERNLLPGHGSTSTWGRELRTSPFLHGAL
ncbi:MBL fold metallo-hydrolase [Neoactinobaculum massilliense]|uniref:MBL fold metallo-hydrolase n=1 Tax=Neoactinobaculum massilliense TaxID=2364794 RepID=UPI000F51F9ED|nr:MBL fold metallo-hydrolase [Neoactinobaculum massilliense]